MSSSWSEADPSLLLSLMYLHTVILARTAM